MGVFVALLITVGATAGSAGNKPQTMLAEAIRLFQTDFESQKCAELLHKVLSAQAPAPIRAKAHLYLGLIAFNENDPDQARVEFALALQAHPGIELPASASPKVGIVFAQAKRDVLSQLAAPVPRPREAPPPADVPPSQVVVVAPDAPLNPLETEERKPTEPKSHALFWTLGAAGLACAGVAIYGAVDLANFNSLVSSTTTGHPISNSQASSAIGQANFWQVAWVVFAIAGVGGLTAAGFAW